jgi:hypothetical protein
MSFIYVLDTYNATGYFPGIRVNSCAGYRRVKSLRTCG